MIKTPTVRFDEEVAGKAAERWGFNCGPGALCGVLDMTPEELRPHMLDFESKGYTNPTLIYGVLKQLGIKHRTVFRSDDFARITTWPEFGLCRVQWHGPWTKPGVPMQARYRQTHWIGVSSDSFQRSIFDINAIEVGGWIWSTRWETELVPWLLRVCVPRASGAWSITHSIEIKLK